MFLFLAGKLLEKAIRTGLPPNNLELAMKERNKETNIILQSTLISVRHLNRELDRKKTMPVCLSPEDLKLLEEYAKKKGMTNYNQAIEHLTTKNNAQ
jgi:hypothetical protein